ncbi:MAG TPA: 50S ribosomal protein L24 [Bacteroidales bacterium]|nr:50S ribosomal protein L24 [Bacteroidales bacterium]HSA44246.1 50S ribosomal protein L24 [Bacteroidales bacterium]
MPKKLHIKKGDTVKVIAGDYKGEQGKVLDMYTDKQTAIVEGVNMVTKHTKPNAKSPQGGIAKKEAPVHISNLMVVDNSGKPTRSGRRIDPKSNKLVRYSKKTGEVIK